MFYGCNDMVELKMRYWWCRIAAVGFFQIFVVGSYVRRNSVPYRLLTQKIFSCSGIEELFLQLCQKISFLQDVKKDLFFGGDEGVSNFQKLQKTHNIFHEEVTIVEDKGGCIAKKKAVKLDLF
jgi:hypothetical protein